MDVLQAIAAARVSRVPVGGGGNDTGQVPARNSPSYVPEVNGSSAGPGLQVSDTSTHVDVPAFHWNVQEPEPPAEYVASNLIPLMSPVDCDHVTSTLIAASGHGPPVTVAAVQSAVFSNSVFTTPAVALYGMVMVSLEVFVRM